MIFSDGNEGLRVWEAGIAFSRYILQHKTEFNGKTVVELGSGTGIVGLTLLKHSAANKIVFSDYVPQVNEVI